MDRALFFRLVRDGAFGGRLGQAQVDGMTRILDYWQEHHADRPLAQLAYVFATAKWETAHTMQPVREIGRGKGKPYGKSGSNHRQVAYGRGLVQLTWDRNYERADRELGLGGRLIADYDLALDPATSVAILIAGMIGGWFTGKRLDDYIADGVVYDFVGARRIVNGTDRARAIADLATQFYAALVQAHGRSRAAEVDAAMPATEPDDAPVTTGKPAGLSTTIWAQVGGIVTAIVTPIGTAVADLDWRVAAVLTAGAVLGFGLWTIAERVKKSRRYGI